jgi:hypothetical protein
LKLGELVQLRQMPWVHKSKQGEFFRALLPFVREARPLHEVIPKLGHFFGVSRKGRPNAEALRKWVDEMVTFGDVAPEFSAAWGTPERRPQPAYSATSVSLVTLPAVSVDGEMAELRSERDDARRAVVELTATIESQASNLRALRTANDRYADEAKVAAETAKQEAQRVEVELRRLRVALAAAEKRAESAAAQLAQRPAPVSADPEAVLRQLVESGALDPVKALAATMRKS